MRKVDWENELTQEEMKKVKELLSVLQLADNPTVIEFLDGIWSIYNKGLIGRKGTECIA